MPVSAANLRFDGDVLATLRSRPGRLPGIISVEAGLAGPAQVAGDSGFAAAAVGQKAFVQAVADQAAVGWGSAVDAGPVAVDWRFADGVAATCLELLRGKQQVGVTCLFVSMER